MFQDISNQELRDYIIATQSNGYKVTQLVEVVDYFKTKTISDNQITNKEKYAHLSGFNNYAEFEQRNSTVAERIKNLMVN